MEKGKKAFTPRARLIQILGEQLIKDASVGLLELVKNSYDADALDVQITMSFLNTDSAKIIIRDNGCGMSAKIFLDKWMNPASGHKEKQKKERTRTQLGRLPLGEKGVGRFAAQQIGDRLKLVSKERDSEYELFVSIDWKKFYAEDKELSDVEIEYEERIARDFKSDQSGTLLEISELKTTWTEGKVEKISNILKRMKSPFKGAKNFNVSLKFEGCPEEYSKYEDLEISDILERTHYKLFGIVDDKGMFDFEYEVNLPWEKKISKKEEKFDLNNFGKIKELKKPFLCGGFIVYLHHYGSLDQTSESRKWKLTGKDIKLIKKISGVSVYRDGMRILPYGEPGDDWIELLKRRVQRTGGRIDSRTIIGMVEIDQIANILLKDKTNREGLIENEAFFQFKELVLATVRVLENEKENFHAKASEKKKHGSPVTDAPKVVDGVRSVFSSITEKIDKTASEKPTFAGPLKEIKKEIEQAGEQTIRSVEEQQRENDLLLGLAGTGLAAERFTHEFARLVRSALDSLKRLKAHIDQSDSKAKREVDALHSALEALRNDIRLLGPLFYIKKVAREKELDIKQIIENTLALQDRWIKNEAIKVEVIGETFIIKMREGSCMQIFDNLIDNSIYWLSRKSEIDRRKIRIILKAENKTIYVSDSGSGVVPRYSSRIFDPFFTMKGEDGRGLGLYIVKEILEEKKWDISLVSSDENPDLLQGASFKIVFSGDADD